MGNIIMWRDFILGQTSNPSQTWKKWTFSKYMMMMMKQHINVTNTILNKYTLKLQNNKYAIVSAAHLKINLIKYVIQRFVKIKYS